jgi:hypothetical protein
MRLVVANGWTINVLVTFTDVENSYNLTLTKLLVPIKIFHHPDSYS